MCHLRCQTVPSLHYSSLVMGRLLRVMANLCGSKWFFFLQLFLLNKFCKVLTLKLTAKELFMQVAVTVYVKEKYVLLKSDI